MEYTSDQIIKFYREFSELKNYEDKLSFFDLHFELIPFAFPKMDLQLSCLTDENSVVALIAILRKEQVQLKHFYERAYIVENSNYHFDVKPNDQKQRSHFNQYIISKFLDLNKRLFNTISKKKKNALTVTELEHQLTLLDTHIEWIKHKIDEPRKESFRVKFLILLYKGYTDFSMGSDVMRARKKFIELYFYSYGILLANYRKKITKMILEVNKPDNGFSEWRLKLLVLREVGLLNFFLKLYGNKLDRKTFKNITKLICFILPEISADDTSITQFIKQLLTEKENDFSDKTTRQSILKKLKELSLKKNIWFQ